MKVSPISIKNITNPIKSKSITGKVSNSIKTIAPVLMSTAAASAITASAMVKLPAKEITTEEIEKNLFKRNYEKNKVGSFSKKYGKWDLRKLEFEHESYYLEYKSQLFDKIFPQASIEEFKNLINIGKESGRKLFDKNFDRFFETYVILDSTNTIPDILNLCKENKQNFKVIENIVNQPMDDKLLSSILNYKSSGYKTINASLREKAKNNSFEIGLGEKIKIDSITKYLNTQILPENLKLYRGEGYDILNKVELKNGENIKLGEMMDKAAKSGKDEEIQKIKEFVLDNEITAIEHGFMSTSLSSNIIKIGGVASKTRDGGIKWELTTEPNTKGVFVEALNIRTLFAMEKEFILQRESNLKIKDIDYCKEDGLWHIKASISN